MIRGKSPIIALMVVLITMAVIATGCQSPTSSPPKSSKKAITAFSFTSPAATGTINEEAHTIAITVPAGTDVKALVPTIEITGVAVDPGSGVAHDFTNPATYLVKAEDNSVQSYTVTVTVTKATTKTITAFSFATPSATGAVAEGNHTIAVTVPAGTDVKALIPTVTIDGASVSPASGVAQNFTNPVTYTVTAQDGSTQAYVVTVTVAAAPKVSVTGVSLDKSTATVDQGQTITLVATVTPANATDKTVTWSSSSTGVTVNSSGVVTGVTGNTDATIKATTNDGNIVASCTIRVPGWQVVGSAGSIEANYLSMVLDSSGTPYVAYQAVGGGNFPAINKLSSGVFTSYGGSGTSASAVTSTSLAIDGSTVYLVAAVSGAVSMWSSTGTSWSQKRNIANGAVAGSASVGIKSGIPFIAYKDNAPKGSLVRYKSSDDSWQDPNQSNSSTVAQFSSGDASYISLVYGGLPYVVYQDNADSNKVRVKLWASEWLEFGTGVTTGEANYPSLALYTAGNDKPYVAYQDGTTSAGKATVKKYSNSAWTTVGSAKFTPGTAEWTTLALNSSGEPYVAYRDGSAGNKASVMKYDSASDSWVQLGGVGISEGAVQYVNLAIDSSGVLYLAYKDLGLSSKSYVVKKYK